MRSFGMKAVLMNAVPSDQPQRVPWRGASRVLAAALAVVAVTSCGVSGGAPAAGSAGNGNGSGVTYGAPPTYSAPTQPAGPADPSSPTPPFPEIGPVPKTAGTTSLPSEHWVGYTFPASNVTGVRAEWTEP